MMIRRTFTLRSIFLSLSFASLGALLVIASGCSQDSSNQASGAGESGASSEPVVVTFWHALSNDHEAVIVELIDSFEAANPGIVIEPVQQGRYEQLKLKLSNSLAAGSPPSMSLMYEGWASEFYEDERITPVQSFLDNDSDKAAVKAEFDDIYPAFLKGNERDGVLITLPFNKSTYIVFYNETLFKEAGYDSFPDTLEGLEEAAKKLTKVNSRGNIETFGLGIRTTIEPFTVLLFAQGGEYLTPDADGGFTVIDTPIAAQSLAMIQKLVNGDKVAYVDGGYMSAPFGAQQIACYWGSSAGIPYVVEAAGDAFPVKTASLPLADNENAGYLSQGTNIGIFAGAPEAEQEAAWKFFKHLMSAESVATWASQTGYLPIRRAAMDNVELQSYIDGNPAYKTCVDQLERLRFEPVVSYWEQVRGEIIVNLDAAYLGRESVEKALNAAEERADGVVKRFTKSAE